MLSYLSCIGLSLCQEGLKSKVISVRNLLGAYVTAQKFTHQPLVPLQFTMLALQVSTDHPMRVRVNSGFLGCPRVRKIWEACYGAWTPHMTLWHPYKTLIAHMLVLKNPWKFRVNWIWGRDQGWNPKLLAVSVRDLFGGYNTQNYTIVSSADHPLGNIKEGQGSCHQYHLVGTFRSSYECKQMKWIQDSSR